MHAPGGRRSRVALGFALLAPVPLGIMVALVVAAVGLVGSFGSRTIVQPLSRAEAASDLRAAHPAAPGQQAGSWVDLSWVGDMTLGSQYGEPADGGRALLSAVRGMTRTPDLMLGNLEGTFGTAAGGKCESAAAGTCFAFQAPPANVAGLKDAGFDLVNVANNHALDYGALGQAQTEAALAGAGITWSGLPGDITVLERRGVRVAVVGFAPYRWAASLTDIAAAKRLVTRAAGLADVVVVMVHLGAEGSGAAHVPAGAESYLGEPRGDGRAFAHAVIDAGADVVLGSGPHVLRGMELYRKRLIAYSLGNFVGVHNFSTAGDLALSGLLDVRLNRDGTLQRGMLHSLKLDGSGTPSPDPSRAALRFVGTLSQQDFGGAGVRFDAVGRFR